MKKSILKKIIFLVLFFIWAWGNICGQRLKVNILNGQDINSVVFSVIDGKYKVFSGKTYILTIDQHNLLYLTYKNDSLLIRDIAQKIGQYKNIAIKGITQTCSFKIKPVYPAFLPVTYDDDLIINALHGHLQLINNVYIENYIAGVVQAETGINRPLEFYKSQAVICRTYALKHIFRHIDEGYQLCDKVHCQVYKGRCTHPAIIEAARMTSGKVLVDKDTILITAAFHSNSGGQTQNSENVWLKPMTYLRSIQDQFAMYGRNARWSEIIPADEWQSYLLDQGIDGKGLRNKEMEFDQKQRKKYYIVKEDSIPLRKIRSDWGFKSSFFSIDKQGRNFHFNGKGYGHGVGLCQEGAIYMAQIGYDYREIIDYYYQDVLLLDYFELGIINKIKEKRTESTE